MHHIESLAALLQQWQEDLEGTEYCYEKFQFTTKEFDNVPPVVPKFLMHLQKYLILVALQYSRGLSKEAFDLAKSEYRQLIDETRNLLA